MAGFGRFILPWLFVLPACSELKIDHSENSGLPILASAATIETPTTLELASGKLALKEIGTAAFDVCTLTEATNSTNASNTITSALSIDSLDLAQANLFTAPSYMKVTEVNLRLRKVGGPGGHAFVRIGSTVGADPAPTPPPPPPPFPATSSDVEINTAINTISSFGVLVPFPFGSLELVSGATYSVVLKPQTDATLVPSNYFAWLTTDGTGCTSLPSFRNSSDGGATWSGLVSAGFRRSFFSLTAIKHATAGSASWILGGPPSATWDVSTFSISENSDGKGAGSIIYDLGAGESATMPTYSHFSLTKDQVRTLSDLNGTYLYLRAMLSVNAPGFDRASLGDGSIVAR